MPRPDLAGALEVGERVFLREALRRDQQEIITRNRASRRLHRGFVAPPTDAKSFAAWIKRGREPSAKHLLVCRLEDGAIVGVFTVSQIVRRLFQSAYLGYYAEQPFAGQGYMREAIPLVLRHVFSRMKLHRIEANVQPENVASVALVKRSGFRLEGFSPRYLKIAGRWRDHQRWAMLIDDWRLLRRRQRVPSRRPGRRARPESSSRGRRRSG
ncbi:MAG TPA: GNAT family protein [Candidatus Angelobacter sp.]|nr:GNAT family protein [Candidatus Angelobacter sp.]